MGEVIFDRLSRTGHEEVLFGQDLESGLRCIIAVHSTVLGPALGGTRWYPYGSESDALDDVLRLSEAMTYKAAVAGLDLGGGKAVIIGSPASDGHDDVLRAYAGIVDALGGRYLTAEDVGTTVADMVTIREHTNHVAGLPVGEGGSGDPSPLTARGVLAACRATAHHMWGSDDLRGRRVAVAGVGKVGSALAVRLVEAGCDVVVADVDESAVSQLVDDHGVMRSDVDDILYTDCDILAPCALGGVLNSTSIPRLRCQAVVGAANNQLAEPQDAARLGARGIVYVPDFVANAGGLINISCEAGGYDPDRAASQVEAVGDAVLDVLVRAERQGIDSHTAAVQLARERIDRARSAA